MDKNKQNILLSEQRKRMSIKKTFSFHCKKKDKYKQIIFVTEQKMKKFYLHSNKPMQIKKKTFAYRERKMKIG